jgi:hypothetical protein
MSNANYSVLIYHFKVCVTVPCPSLAKDIEISMTPSNLPLSIEILERKRCDMNIVPSYCPIMGIIQQTL